MGAARVATTLCALAQFRSLGSVRECCRAAESDLPAVVVQALSTRFALALLRSRSALSQQFVSCVVPSAFCFSLSLSHSLILFFLLSIFCTLCLICTFCINVTHTRFATAFVSFVRSLAHSLAPLLQSLLRFVFSFCCCGYCWCCCCCCC